MTFEEVDKLYCEGNFELIDVWNAAIKSNELKERSLPEKSGYYVFNNSLVYVDIELGYFTSLEDMRLQETPNKHKIQNGFWYKL